MNFVAAFPQLRYTQDLLSHAAAVSSNLLRRYAFRSMRVLQRQLIHQLHLDQAGRHLTLASQTGQITMPKRTFQPNRRRRSKVHGFLVRMATKAGQAVLNRRRAKGRHKIAVSAGFRD